jgi:hypothetical protein
MAKYRTMQGKVVDMDKLMTANELMPAIGNVKVNARGDELGPGGKIVKKREEVMAEYYENNPKANVTKVGPKSGIVNTREPEIQPVATGKRIK